MKLIYDGPMYTGKCVLPDGGSMIVIKGQEYDIPDRFVDDLLKIGTWKKVKEEKIIHERRKTKAVMESPGL